MRYQCAVEMRQVVSQVDRLPGSKGLVREDRGRRVSEYLLAVRGTAGRSLLVVLRPERVGLVPSLVERGKRTSEVTSDDGGKGEGALKRGAPPPSRRC